MILPPICSISLAKDMRQAAPAHNPVNRSEHRGVYASFHRPACVEANDAGGVILETGFHMVRNIEPLLLQRPLRYKSHDRPVDDVLSALVNLCYQPQAAEKAIENAIAKDKPLAGDFDGLFHGASKVIR